MPPSPVPEVPDSSIDPTLRDLPAPTRPSRPLLRSRSRSQPKSYKPQKPHIGSSSSSGSESDDDDDLEFQGKAQGDGEFRLSDLSEIDDEEEEERGVGQDARRNREWEEEGDGFAFGDWNRIGTGGDIVVGSYDEPDQSSSTTPAQQQQHQQGEGEGEGDGNQETVVKKRKKTPRDPSIPRPIPMQRQRLLEIAARSSRALMAASSAGAGGGNGSYGNGIPITSYASGSLPGWEGMGFNDTTAGRGRSCENCRHRKTRCSSHEICESCASRSEQCIWKTGTPLYATPAFKLPVQVPTPDFSISSNGQLRPQPPSKTYELYPSPTYATLVAETSRLRRLANILTNRWCMRESVLANVEGRVMRRCVGMQDVKVEDEVLELPTPPPSLVKRVENGQAGDKEIHVEAQVVSPDEAAKGGDVGEGEDGAVQETRENTELEDAAILLALSQPQSRIQSQIQTPQNQSPAPVASTSNLPPATQQSGRIAPNSTTNDGNEMIDPVLRNVGPPPIQRMKPPPKPKQRTQPTFPQHLAPPFPSALQRTSQPSASSPRVRSFSAQDQHQYRPVPPLPTRPGQPKPRVRSVSANNHQPQSVSSADLGPPYPPGYRPVSSSHRGVPYHPQQRQSKPKGPSRSSSSSKPNYDYNPAYHLPSYMMPSQSQSQSQNLSRRPSTINPQALPKFPATVIPTATTTSKKRSSSSSITARSITATSWIAGIPPRGGPSPPLFFPAIPSPSMSAQQQAKNESDRSLERMRRTHWEWREKRRTWHEERFERCLLRQAKRETGTPASQIGGNKKRKTSNNAKGNGKGGGGKGKQPTAQERSLATQAAETWATLNAVNQRQAQAQSVAARGQRDRERNKLPPIIVPVQPYRSISSSQVGPFREDAMFGGSAMMLGPSNSMLSAMDGAEGSRRSAGSGGADGRRFSQWLMSPLSSTFNPLPSTSTSSQGLPSTSATTNGHDLSSLASAFDHTIPISSRPRTPPSRPDHRIAIDSPDRSRYAASPNTVDAGLKPLSELFGSATDSVDERFEPRLEKDDTFGGSGAAATDGMDWDPFEPIIEARGGDVAGGGGTQDLGWNSPGRVAQEQQEIPKVVIEDLVTVGSDVGEREKGNVEVESSEEKGKENVDTSEINAAIAALDSIRNH